MPERDRPPGLLGRIRRGISVGVEDTTTARVDRYSSDRWIRPTGPAPEEGVDELPSESPPFRLVGRLPSDGAGDPAGPGAEARRSGEAHVVDGESGRTYCGLNVDGFETLEGDVNLAMACHACELEINRRASG